MSILDLRPRRSGHGKVTKLEPELSKALRPEDEALVSRARTGDREAFSELVRRHQRAVYRVCYRVLSDREDAEDATQEAFIRAYDRLNTFAGRSAFRTWMLRLAVNVGLNKRERRRPKARLDEQRPPFAPDLDLHADSDPEAGLLRSETERRLHDALGELPRNHRAAVALHDLEGLSYSEAAEILDAAEGTVRQWAYRGRRRLKELLV